MLSRGEGGVGNCRTCYKVKGWEEGCKSPLIPAESVSHRQHRNNDPAPGHCATAEVRQASSLIVMNESGCQAACESYNESLVESTQLHHMDFPHSSKMAAWHLWQLGSKSPEFPSRPTSHPLHSFYTEPAAEAAAA